MTHDDLIRSEFLDSIRASVKDYPLCGGDIVIMESIDRIVKEKTIRVIELENTLYGLLKSIERNLDFTPDILNNSMNRAEDVLRRRNDHQR